MNLLGIYLNDHLAGATVGIELARRTRALNKENEVGRHLDGLLTQLTEDRDTLRSVMSSLGVAENPAKRAAGWLAEKVGRLKLNGRLVGYSPLSRLEELEALSLGVEGKLSLWRTLKLLLPADGRLAGLDTEAMVRRAQAQRAELERLREMAASDAFGAPRPAPAPKPRASKPPAAKTAAGKSPTRKSPVRKPGARTRGGGSSRPARRRREPPTSP